MNKKTSLIFSVALIVVLMAGISIGLYDSPNQYDSIVATSTKHDNTVNLVGRHADGTVFLNYTTHNLLTQTGSSYFISMIANTTVSTKAVYMTLSTDATPLVTWTKLPNEITTNNLGKTAAITPTYGTCTTTNGVSTYMLVTTTWTASGTQAGIVAMGLGYTANAGANDLVAAAAISSASVISGDSLQGTWNVTVPVG